MQRPFSGLLGLSIAALLAGKGMAATPMASVDLNRLADRWVALQLSYEPTRAYLYDLPVRDHRRWADRSPQAIRAFQAEEDRIYAELGRIDAARLDLGDRTEHAILREELESSRLRRVCRFELWNINQIEGWQLGIALTAGQQPVETADQRAQAVERWRALPRFIDQEIANLRTGLTQGYSAPKSAVRRVIRQIDGLAGAAPEASPLFAPAKRSNDPAFADVLRNMIAADIAPALRRYQAFLETEYLPKAREALGVSANPNGAACYQASLRTYTTLDRSAKEVHDLGAAAVARNVDAVTSLSARLFDTRDIPTIVQRIAAAPDNRFESEADLVAFARETVERARQESAKLFETMPTQTVLVEPFPEFARGSGVSAQYDVEPDKSKPAYYRITTEHWQREGRGNAEITAVHEAYPGHHLQLASKSMIRETPLRKLAYNSAYGEGWGRYAEALAEEAGIYRTPYAAISRRLWPARGMVADPGLHMFGWSRERTVAYLVEAGRFTPDQVAELVDRMAVLPGQVTAYDSGALEIMALRQEAQQALGARFDIRRFHREVLRLGGVPLATLRQHIEGWIRAEAKVSDKLVNVGRPHMMAARDGGAMASIHATEPGGRLEPDPTSSTP